MDNGESLTAQKLLKSLGELKRLHKQGSPITGLTHSESMIIFCIEKQVKTEKDGIKTSELSNILKVASPTITQQINNLESKGYVGRSADKSDRRVVRIKLTEKGNLVLKQVKKEFRDAVEGLAGYLGDEKTNQLSELISEVYTYFSEIKNKN